MPRGNRVVSAVVTACAVVAVAVVVAVLTLPTGGPGVGRPATPETSSPTHRSSHRPEDAASGATPDEKPGTGSSYWTDERRREASPAEMPQP